MRSPAQTNTWEYWIPGWSQILAWRDLLSGNAKEGIFKTFGQDYGYGSTADLAESANSILGNSRDEYLADREHTEMREDTAYQRAVADMRAAGLNPYTIGATPANSSASAVNEHYLTNKLQVLGYILDLKNLDAKNRKITNDTLTNILSMFKK